MNIHELDSYDLGDAVKFNDRLNPRLWGADEKLRPEVREQLLRIADDFREFLGIDVDLEDITVSGSNASYTYTPHSDIDLHLVVDLPQADANEVYRELFDAKKYAYNDQHNITIGGYDVELYVQDARKPHISQGIYSVKNNDWVSVPKRRKPDVNDISVRSKFEDLGHRIESAIASGDYEQIASMARKVKEYRQAGLDQHGEFGPENLAFKILRKQGLIQKLYDARAEAKDQLLSLDERKKKRKKKSVRYGYGGYWYPGTAYAGQDHPAGTEGGGGDGGGGESVREDVGMTWDGVSPDTDMFTSEDAGMTPSGVNPTTAMFTTETDAESDEQILQDFVKFCVDQLNIERMPRVKLRRDPEWCRRNRTFGRYNDDAEMLEVAWGNRHIMDVLRTVAHELTHKHQHEREAVPADAGETGSAYENEANAQAGILMRAWAQKHPDHFESGSADVDENWKQKAGAVAAAACIAGTPGCSTTGQVLKTTQDVGRTAQTAKNMTRTGVQAELGQELRNFIRAQGGDPGSQNLSTLYQLQKRMIKKPDATNESASGYIPTKRQAKDPRYSMALTVDIKPGQVGKEANKLKLKTNSRGQPQIARPSGIFEQLMMEYQASKLDRPTSTVANIAKKHKTTVDKIKAQLNKGIRVEKEHTTDVATAREIALDHLAEFPDYYDRLARVETNEDQQLDEVKMSPSALMQWAQSEAAQGIRSGFEAELIFRDTTNDDDDDTEMEPDYDYDERARSVQGVIDFFQGGDYGGLSQREESRLQDGLNDQYMEWQDERMYDAWRDERDDLIREAWLREKPMGERIISALTDGMGIDDADADRILAAGDAAPRFTKSSDQQEYERQNKDYELYRQAEDIADKILDEDVEQTIEKEDGFYDEVLDEFRENFYVDDDSGFFQDVGLGYMSDIASEYSLDWPYLTGGGGGNNGGSREWSEIGDNLQDAIDMPVRVSSGYHSEKRREGQWIVEPDSSLSPDDREDFGLEIVSPPLPLLTTLEKLQEVTDWANDPNGGNAYTNSSTGLHMGVSVPYKGGDVDYLKLILFLGDEYVLQSFGREANTYTKSAMKSFRENIRSGRADPAGALTLMKNNLIEFAYREIQKGVGGGKYTSAHIQKGYIEFRSAGGDWLAEESADPQKLSSTMLRYARAMQIAANPSEERREYAKKLYKLVSPEGDTELALFSQFAAGELDKEQLKKRWAEKQLDKVPDGKGNWVLWSADGKKVTGGLGEYYNFTKDAAWDSAWKQIAPNMSLEQFKQAYNLRPMTSKTGDWEVYDVNTGKTLETLTGFDNRGAAADSVYDKYAAQGIGFNLRPADPEEPEREPSKRELLARRIAEPKPDGFIRTSAGQATAGAMNWVVTNRDTGQQVYSLPNKTRQEAAEYALAWLRQQGLASSDYQLNATDSQEQAPDVTQNFEPVQVTSPDGQPMWEIYKRDSGEVVHTFTSSSQPTAWEEAKWWLRSTGIDPANEYSLRPKMSTQ
jgi:hypothetical protein